MTNNPTPPSLPPLPVYGRESWFYKFGRVICRIVTINVFDLKVYGIRNVPRRGGVLIVGNHQSFLDPVLYTVRVPRPASFLAKSELFEGNPHLTRLIRALNAFPVRQGEGDVGAVRETIKRLQEGHVLVMFPEGGRTHDGEVEPLLGGVGLIVRRAGPTVRVVPAAMHGAYEAWSRHRKFPRSGRIRVKYGEALELSHLKAAEIVKVIEGRIRGLFKELKEEAGIHGLHGQRETSEPK